MPNTRTANAVRLEFAPGSLVRSNLSGAAFTGEWLWVAGDEACGLDRLRRLAPVERPRVEFVFVSVDESPDIVQKFRDEHWAMPWTHAFSGGDRQTEVKARFGFSGVPTAILVDGAGTIVEVGNALRGERLLQTLERALASVAP